MSFIKAERKRAKIKVAITGPSGSGKSYSSLLMASGLGKNIAAIDTERESLSFYDNLVDFKIKNLEKTDIDSYVNAINEAVAGGFDVLIIDSISHQWKTLLEEKTHVDSRGGNSFTNWSKFTPEQDRFMNAILRSDIHIICTVRSKQEFSIVQDGGKNKVQKLGMAPVQREGLEYEFGIVFDVAMNHEASVSKDRTGLFVDKIFKITKETGTEISTWLNNGKEVGPGIRDLMNLAAKKGFEPRHLKELLVKMHNIESSKEMSDEQIRQMHAWISNNDINNIKYFESLS